MSESPDPKNRRVEPRVAFESDCSVEPRAPAWTLMPAPLIGETVNLTENGIRVRIAGFDRERYEKWHQHLSSGETIQVRVVLHRSGEALAMEGEVVWLGFSPDEEEIGGRAGECALGVLLSLLPEATRGKLRALMAG